LTGAELLESISSVVLSSEKGERLECIRIMVNALVDELLAMLLSRLISLARVEIVVRPS